MGGRTELRLSPAMFEILLCLAGGELHGYAIMKEVRDRTGGEVSLGPTSLYRSLEKLLRLGYIKQVESETGAGDSDRRVVYKLLEAGRDAAARRADSLARSVDVARRRRLLSGEGTS
jgi:DNA-binding PadR family transcriptional regulator